VGEQLKLQDNVFHLGSLPRPDLLQVLSLADLFIMPNISVPGDIEGFGLVALEASIRGTFVIASGIEGITDAVTDSKNGCLLPSENASVWIDKIHELLSDKEELNTVSKQGKEFTREHYSWEIMVNGYRAVFDRLIDHSSND
ncbi:MAG: glycosyltransferase, partial [Petrimonas sp.]|nr:glycosyltransferase [Petrimonas sp.]